MEKDLRDAKNEQISGSVEAATFCDVSASEHILDKPFPWMTL